jgi:hypothetical protein
VTFFPSGAVCCADRHEKNNKAREGFDEDLMIPESELFEFSTLQVSGDG